MNETSKFKPGDRVVVKTLPKYTYGRGNCKKWEGVETTVVGVNKTYVRSITVDRQPFTEREFPGNTYTFDESELELSKSFYLDKFYEQI